MKSTSRRKQLILRYGLLSFSLILVVSVIVLLAVPRAKPYTPGETIEGITSELERTLPADYPRVTFTDATSPAGIHFKHFHGERSTQLPEDMGSGAAWGDFDRDGDPDLYICNMAGPLTFTEEEIRKSPATNMLYRNNGDGTFSDVTSSAGVGYRGSSMSAAWGDFDGDDLPDLFVTNYGANKLYRNNGNGTFRDVSIAARVHKPEGFWTGASWRDFDRDGDLDIYVCGYVRYRFNRNDLKKVSGQYKTLVPFTLNPSSYEPERNLLFVNNGNGTFTETARKLGVDNSAGRSLSASWCDFNQDGYPDLYVANDISDNAMFMNPGNGKFADVAQNAWVADYRGAMGLAVADWNNDGDMDLFITHWIAQENALFDNLFIPLGKKSTNAFTRFSDIADRVGLGQIALDFIGWGTSFFDYDNDGNRDLLVINGSTFQDESDPRKLIPMRHLLFWNRAREGFFELSRVSGEVLSRPSVGRGAAFADYDLDGDVDAIVVNHNGPPLLLRNDGGNANNWLRVRADSPGAKVEITVQGKTLLDEIGAQSSYLSQNEMVAHFGIGSTTVVERVQVIFPMGKAVEFTRVKANQTIYVPQDSLP